MHSTIYFVSFSIENHFEYNDKVAYTLILCSHDLIHFNPQFT